MGEIVLSLCGDTNHFKDFVGSLSPLLGSHIRSVEKQNFFYLRTDLHDRVKAGHGILKDHRNSLTADVAHCIFRSFSNVHAVKNYLPTSDFSYFFRKQAQNAQCNRGLSCTCFPDKTKSLSSFYIK